METLREHTVHSDPGSERTDQANQQTQGQVQAPRQPTYAEHIQEKPTSEDIKKIMACYRNIETITENLRVELGTTDDTRGVLQDSVTKNGKYPKNGLTADLLSKRGEHTLTVNDINSNPYVSDAFGINGSNQHVNNPLIYLTIAPHLAQKTSTDLFNSSHALLFLHEEMKKDLQKETELKAGQDYLSKVVNRIFKQEQNRPLKDGDHNGPYKTFSILVLGDTRTGENMEIYGLPEEKGKGFGPCLRDHKQLRQNCHTFNLQNILGSGKKIRLFYLHAPKNYFGLTGLELEGLYDIYEQTLGSENPLLIHSEAGLERAPKVVFAFELLRNFRKCFVEPQSIDEAVKRILEVFNQVRRSRSPIALSNYQNFVQAIHLAFALKLHSYERVIVRALFKLANDNNEPTFATRKQAISHLLGELVLLPTCKQRYEEITKAIYVNNELSTHHDYQKYLWYKPEYYELLSLLKYTFDCRSKLDKMITAKDLCKVTEIETAPQQDQGLHS